MSDESRRDLISYHLQRAEMMLRQCESATDERTIELWSLRASAHSLQARALQEEERLDGCTRHHGQARP